MENLRVLSLKATNIKKLKAVELNFTGTDAVSISGRNSQGKSSVLDALFWTLAGPRAVKDDMLKHGEESGSATVDLGEFTVTRTIKSGKPPTLTITGKDGEKWASGQSVLDGFLGAYSFDPTKFLSLDGKQQRVALLELLGLGDTVADLDSKRAQAYSKRTQFNRESKEKTASAKNLNANKLKIGLPIPSSKEVIDEMNAANKIRRAYDSAVERVASAEEELNSAKLALANCAVPTDDTDYESKLQGLGAEADAIRLANEWLSLTNKAKEFEAQSEECTKEIDNIDDSKKKLIMEAGLPIEGLTFSEDGLLLNDIPLTQASQSERIRVSMALAMMGEPKIRVLQLREASLIDSDGLQMVKKMASDQGFQVFLEIVGDGGANAVVIEDGSVV